MDTDSDLLSLRGVTWNVLNQAYIRDQYTHVVDRSVLAWDYRLPLIIEILSSFKADVLFLQEVELKTAAADFRDLFDTYDYSVHEVSKKRSSHMGNMTLWKKSVFSLKLSVSNSYGLHVVLLHRSSGLSVWFSNVHLKGGTTSGLEQRSQQLTSCLKMVSKHCSSNSSVHRCIVGDFNDEMKETGPSFALLHASGYSCVESPISSTINNRSFRFDRIVSTKEVEVVYSAKGSLATSEVTNEEGETPAKDMLIPSPAIPSDHVPIEFVIRIQ